MIRIFATGQCRGAKRYYATADYYSEGRNWSLLGRKRPDGSASARDKFSSSGSATISTRIPVNADGREPAPKRKRPVSTSPSRSRSRSHCCTPRAAIRAFSTLPGRSERDDAGRGSGMKTRVRKPSKTPTAPQATWSAAESSHHSRPIDASRPAVHATSSPSTRPGTRRRALEGWPVRELKRDAPYFQGRSGCDWRTTPGRRLRGRAQAGRFRDRRRPADVLARCSRRTAVIEKLAAERASRTRIRRPNSGRIPREQGNGPGLGTAPQGVERPPE